MPVSDDPTDMPIAPALRHVLVVEDEALVRMLVVQVLQEAGYSVSEAAEATGALAQIGSGARIDLMVTDVGLPGVNGRQLADQARALRPDLTVLFMTGYAESGLVDMVMPDGFGLITKPFDLDDLAGTVEGLIAG